MKRTERDFYHELHCNFNRFNNGKHGEGFTHWMYEAKNAMEERRRLPLLFKKEREGTLPKRMQYCSHSETEIIEENALICCLGKETLKCEYLLAIFKDLDGKFPPEMIDEAKAEICIGHILQEKSKHAFDTSEGYIQDATSRMFWQRTYHYLSMPDPDEEEVRKAQESELVDEGTSNA